MHELETIGDNLEEQNNQLKTENQILEKETENYAAVENLNQRLKHDLEAAEKKIEKNSFQHSNLTNQVCCLQEELHYLNSQAIDSNKPAPAPSAEPAKVSFPYMPVLATFAVAAVAFFIGRR